MEDSHPKKIVEALLFITNRPLSADELLDIIGKENLDKKALTTLIHEISRELDERGSAIQLVAVAGGYQMATRTLYAPSIRKLYKDETTARLSTSALETLSILTYKQPITRAEIEEIRGVEVIAVLETLMERKLVKILGRKETIGRPLLYGTTTEFLRHFGLNSLGDLPPLPTPAPTSASPEASLTENLAPAEPSAS